jgi:hypothetical protein
MKRINFAYKTLIMCFYIFVLGQTTGFSQNVGISPTGAIAPDASAGLDVNYTTQGLLIPRVALTSTAASTPLTAQVAGMVVYNTATAGDVIPGIYVSNGTKWVVETQQATSSGDMWYWNGTTWVSIPIGTVYQRLQVNASGVPTWAP